jgi:hypothetical protein
MTEAEWWICKDSMQMINWVRERISSRKTALFACACCRRLWPWLTEAGRSQVVALELHADDSRLPPLDEAVFFAAIEIAKEEAPPSLRIAFNAAELAVYCGYLDILCTASEEEIVEEETPTDAALQVELEAQPALVRDILGNPFHTCVVDSQWLEWNDASVKRIAQTIYDERAFDLLPILADALEDAYCNNCDLIEHCRQPGEHVRGCWVIDLLLGKH